MNSYKMANLKESWYSDLYERKAPINIAINKNKYNMISKYIRYIAPYIDNASQSATIGIYPIKVNPNEQIVFSPHLTCASITIIINIDPTVKYKIQLQPDEDIIIPATFILPYTTIPVYLIAENPTTIYICHVKNIRENYVYRPISLLTQYDRNLLTYYESENVIRKMFNPSLTDEQDRRIRENTYIYEKELEMQMKFETLNQILNKYIL